MFIASDNPRRLACSSSLWAIALLMALVSGCRTARDNQIEILERELRTQEDYIYELEDYVIQYSDKLRSMRCAQAITIESETKSSNSIVKKSTTDTGPELRDNGRGAEDSSADELKEPKAPEPEQELNLDDFEPPPLNIEEPVGGIQVSTTDGLAQVEERRFREPDVIEEPTIPSPVEYPEIEQTTEPTEVAVIEQFNFQEDLFEDQDVTLTDYETVTDREEPTAKASPTRIVVKQLFRDDEPGTPQRLLAVVEGLDEEGQPIEFTGDVSLMVMVAKSERPFRLKRWDFNSQDVSAAWQASHLGEGLHMELPLEDTVLPNVPLELWVRLIDPLKTKLLTQKSFQRSKLAGLEVETGAKELQPKEQVQLAAKPTKKTPSTIPKKPSNSGWRSSTRSTAQEKQGFATSLREAGGWTAQSSSGKGSSTKEPTTKIGKRGPVWTAGRPRSGSTTSR